MTTWRDAQLAEAAWWGDCTNTLAVEIEQMDAAVAMGLDVRDCTIHTAGTIVDIGGGAVSLLLKSVGWDRGLVVDPGDYPAWVAARYTTAHVEVAAIPGEVWLSGPNVQPDEVWIYNTLQHVLDPEFIVRESVKLAPVVRVFEWVGYETNDCHIHVLDAALITAWGLSPTTIVDFQTMTFPDNGLAYAAVFSRSA